MISGNMIPKIRRSFESTIVFIPKMTQKLADRRVQSAKNRSSQRGLCCLDTTPFGMIDFWQLSIPPIGQLLSHLGYKALCFFCLFFAAHLHSMKIEPYQFEDLMGEISPVWYRLTTSDRERLAYFKELFMKNNEISPQAQSKIPTVSHWIWLGPKPFPEKSKKNVLSWKALHPNWKMKFWTDNPKCKPPIPGMQVCPISSLPSSPISHLIPRACNYGEKSDLVRYVILFNEGGVYVDHDVLAFAAFDTLNKQYDFYAYLETPLDLPLMISDNNVRINNGLVGSKPGHPILEKIMMHLLKSWDDLQFKYPNNDRDSQIIRTLKRSFFAFTEGVTQAIDQPGNCDIVFPASFGCPRFGFNDIWVKNQLKARSLIYAEHFHDSLWCSTTHTKNKILSRTFYLVLHLILAASTCFFIFYKKRKPFLKIASRTTRE